MDNSIVLNKDINWKLVKKKNFTIHYKGFGYFDKNDKNLCFEKLGNFLFFAKSQIKIKNYIKQIDGHFSFIYYDKFKTLACVDWIRSYPIFYSSHKKNVLKITNDPKLLLQGTTKSSLDKHAVIDLFASGYTTQNTTIFLDIKQLTPGTILLKSKSTNILSYKGYFPQQPKIKLSYPKLKKKFVDSIDRVFSRLADKNKGRMIFVPLSAGIDSRLVLSSLLRHNHKQITCYSYGLKNNSEIRVAKEICHKLDVSWKVINTSPNIIKQFSKTEFYKNYMNFSDNFSSVPFIQDLPALFFYKKKYKIPSDTLFINGNTGDFISGGHIPKELFNNNKLTKGNLIESFINKHFSLWERCLSPPYYPIIYKRINQLIKHFYKYHKNSNNAALFETLEWAERQSKFVITGQRVYDYIEKDWKLPFWEDPIKRFFEELDYDNKFNQYFYKKVLEDLNWSNIWRNIPINKKETYPVWMRPVRFSLKACFFPIGKMRWKKFEKKYINYWTSYISSEALVSYFNLNKFKDNYRNAVSLRSIEYLKKHGIDYL